MAVSWLILPVFTIAAQAQTASLEDLAGERAVVRFLSNCDAQGKALWGKSLCGPIVIVDAKTHWTVASEPDPDKKFEKRGNVYVGVLPSNFDVANTAFDWGGRRWTMVMSPLPVDPYSQVALVTHEAFHRVQDSMGLSGSDQPNPQLDTMNGRLWFRLELRALARALRAESDRDLLKSVADALLFRAQRYSSFEGARQREAALERQEGLPEYTGTMVAMKETGEVASRVARQVESFEDQQAYARSFAYVTGPAMGLLLDRLAPEWRKRVRGGASLESQLIESSQFKVPSGLEAAAVASSERYGFRAVAASEREREARHQAFLESLTKTFVDGPALSFPKTPSLYRNFNPYALVPFGAQGTFYPTGAFRAEWGTLKVESVGAILSSDNMSVRVAAPADAQGRPVKGPGWTLELAPGWTIRPVSGRAGSFEVISAGNDARQ